MNDNVLSQNRGVYKIVASKTYIKIYIYKIYIYIICVKCVNFN